tara:strand:+ start:224 stop:499 length:276 start_codon:yes stop_codon:yes gene_type:complete
MAKELNEDTNFKVSVKTLISIGVGLSMLIGMWFTLQAQINEAKLLPVPEVSKMEFDMKDENIRLTIMTTQEDVKEIKNDMRRIEDKIDKLN